MKCWTCGGLMFLDILELDYRCRECGRWSTPVAPQAPGEYQRYNKHGGPVGADGTVRKRGRPRK